MAQSKVDRSGHASIRAAKTVIAAKSKVAAQTITGRRIAKRVW
jgi:hypothetical protein